MAWLSGVTAGARSGLENALKTQTPTLCSRASKKSMIVSGLALTLLVSLYHLAYHATTIGGKPPHMSRPPSRTLHSKLIKELQHDSLETAVPPENFHDGSQVLRTPRARLKILVMSYMRSGSTLCGNILQAHPDVFYVYEPLLYLWDHYLPDRAMIRKPSLRQRAKQLWRQTKSHIPPPLDFLSYMFRCNMTSYNLDFLTNVAHSRAFVESGCSRRRGDSNVMYVTKKCARGVQQRCDQSKAIVQKAVRVTMEEAGQLLERDPDIRLVHLVRDPRGVLLSRIRFNNKKHGEMHKNYTSICLRMEDDMRESRRIADTHRGRVLTVRYEDLAQDLIGIASTIYNFAGLRMRPEVKNYLNLIMSSDALNGEGKIAAKSSFRKDPFKTAYRWREDLPFSLVKQVDGACGKVYQALGYRDFSVEDDLRDLDVPAKLATFGEDLFVARLQT